MAHSTIISDLDTRSAEPIDENLICPVTGVPLFASDRALVAEDGSHRYAIEDGILRLFVDDAPEPDANAGREGRDEVTRHVRDFYEDAPFPNYNDFDTSRTFIKRADEGLFARLLREQIPMNANVLEVGCGTGQLSNYLAATCMARVYAADMTLASLQLGRDFARANQITGITFLQMNLFRPCMRPESMDVLISNGVLHHTYDTKAAFMSIVPLVRKGGYIVVGLYNRIGRLRTDLRRALYGLFGERILILDPHLRKNLSPAKRRAWIRDQYLHPQERKHTMNETLGWFDEAGIEFTNSIPKIVGEFTGDEKLFHKNDPGRPIDRVLAEVGMLFSHFGGEGGLYVMIGRKR
jgi:2-polyprenyl-3-methyl-5-hydroxy-6-metoxy-1,4-benzoquinol methylase